MMITRFILLFALAGVSAHGAVTLTSPYTGVSNYARVGIHMHSDTSVPPDPVGNHTLASLVRFYLDTNNYGAIISTEHDSMETDPGVHTNPTGIFIQGTEYTAAGSGGAGAYPDGHVLGLWITNFVSPVGVTRQSIINTTVNQGGLAILAHPNITNETYFWSMPAMLFFTNYFAIELLQGWGTNWPQGRADHFWNRLLASNKMVYATADLDTHKVLITNAWNDVFTEVTNSAAIKSNLAAGNFIASKNHRMRVTTDGATIYAQTYGVSSTFEWIMGPSGTTNRTTTSATTDSYTVTNDISWIRVQSIPDSDSEAIAWSQPITVEYVPAVDWYVDIDATGSSANDGTSWADAFTNLASITWASIAPGDTVHLSDGTYTGYITPTVSGTEAYPILLKASQEPGHNGRIDLPSGFKPNGVAWITLDGAKDDSYTNQISSTFDVPNITNNINIHMAQFAYTSGDGPLGLRVKWVEMSFPEPTSPGQQCVLFSAASGGDATNVSISYSAIHTSGDFGVYASGDNVVVGWDDFTIDHCYIYNTGDDPIQWGSGGLTMHHNYVGETARTQGHGDCLQAHSDHIRFYNNIVRDQHNSGLRIEALQSETVWTHGVHVYGNLWFCRDFDSVGAEHVAFLTYGNFVGPQVYTNSYWTNVVFANNTWARIPDPGTPLAISKRTNYLTVTIRGFKIQNNLIWTTAPRSASEQGVAIGGTTGWDYSIGTDLIFDHNVVSGVATNVGTGITSTSSAEPTFADAAADDYTLAASDTVARNQGTDLSALDLPGWETDMMGNTRGADGYVDLGAFEYTGDLLVRIDFEDTFTDSTLSDSSGNGNHGHRFGRPGSVAPTNFPIRVAASATGGTNASTYAGDFYWNTNSDYGFYLKDGNYAAITNVPAFTNRSQMTIAVRARYSPASRIDPAYDSSTDGNATLISAGSASADIGSWDLQRFNESVSLNNTRFMVVTNSNFGIPQVGSSSAAVFGKSGRAVFNFPDRGFDNNGDTTNWHHYAMTFNAGIVVTYFDGEPIVTNDLSGTTTTLTVGMNVSVDSSSGFIGIGANTHGGTPALEDETGEDYPNHGWFNGQMDDVVIYSRALTGTEIATLSGYPVEEGSGGGQGVGSSNTPRLSPTFRDFRAFRP